MQSYGLDMNEEQSNNGLDLLSNVNPPESSVGDTISGITKKDKKKKKKKDKGEKKLKLEEMEEIDDDDEDLDIDGAIQQNKRKLGDFKNANQKNAGGSDNGSEGNGSQRYPRIPGVVAPADSRAVFNETPDVSKNTNKFHQTLDVQEDALSNNDNTSQGGTRYVIGLKPGQSLGFYGNAGNQDINSQNGDLDRQSNENAYDNRPMTSDNMAGTMTGPGGFRGRKPANNMDKASSQASLESGGSPRAASFQMAVVDQDDNSSLEKGRKEKGDKKKKKKKDKDKKRDKSEPAEMRRNDSAPVMADQLQEISKDEISQAYDNNSQFDDNKSQMSISKASAGAGNGISRAPGADGRKREQAIAAALERQTSSATKIKTATVDYSKNNISGANLGGSQGSFILEDEADKIENLPGAGHFQRVSDLPADNFLPSISGNDSRNQSDIGLIKNQNYSQNQNNYSKMTDDVFTKSDMAKSINQPQGNYQQNYTPPFKKGIDGDNLNFKDYNTGDQLINSKNPDGYAQEIMDMEHGLKARRPFTRDDFRLMINSTYTEYYGKFRDQYNPDEYMQCVDDDELVKRFGAFLEQSEDNMLTRENMPWLDLGDIPTTHSFMRSESQQVYYIPQNMNPELVYINYSNVIPKYKASDPKGRFEGSDLPKYEITFKSFQNTLNLCTIMMRSYRGKIWFYDTIGYATIVVGMLIIILLGVATSSSEKGNWGNMVLYILLYFIFVPIVYKVSQCFQCKYLRQAHFVLSVVCRAENNRYYLKRGVEVRPGYLAKWVLFSILKNDNGKSVVQTLRDRHEFLVKEQAKNVEADHLKYMDGVNRNFNTQAVEIRIQIEQAKLGRELTPEEKNKIVESQINRNKGNGPIVGGQDDGGANKMKQNPLSSDQQAENALIAAANGGQAPAEQESSGSVSSDWDDWNDPEYIEEQRQALVEFQKKQKDLKVAHGSKKKKKKSKKKKKAGATGGDALDADFDDGQTINQHSGFDPIKESYLDEELDSDRYEEEEKINKGMSQTRIEQDRSQFDAPSIDNNDQSYNYEDKIGGNIYNQQNIRKAAPGGLQNQDSENGSQLISDTPSAEVSNQGLIKR